MNDIEEISAPNLKGKDFLSKIEISEKIEEFLLQKAPGALATRQRFFIFQKLLSDLMIYI